MRDFPRIPLAVLSTPIQKLENISRLLNTNVYIKRDDLTGIGLGGNKVRKLEFLLADAKRKGAEVVFTTGGAQSNHAMLTAACAKKLGMEPILILKKHGVTERKGNQLLEYLMDTDVRFMDTDSYDDIYAEMDRVGKAFAGLVKMAREGQVQAHRQRAVPLLRRRRRPVHHRHRAGLSRLSGRRLLNPVIGCHQAGMPFPHT